MFTPPRKRALHDTPIHYGLVFINLFWLFVTVWSAWGMGAVVLLAATVNHVITRYELRARRLAAGPFPDPLSGVNPPSPHLNRSKQGRLPR